MKRPKSCNLAGGKASVILAAVVLPFLSIFAQRGWGKYSGGTGAPENPFRITTPQDLNDIGNHKEDWDKDFVLVNDVNLAQYTGSSFNMIGNSPQKFTGVFDGNDNKIWNFTWSSADINTVGLFVFVGSAGEIKNLGLENIDIDGSTGSAIGALVGRNCGGTITNCYSTGSISGNQYIGGLVGYNEGTIVGCYSTVTIVGESQVGGLAGGNTGTISDSNSAGSVDGDKQRVGGLVGGPSSGTIINCFSTAEVGGSAELVGGLTGDNTGVITGCYATGKTIGAYYVGGLTGLNEGSISNCHSTGNAIAVGVYPHFAGALVGCNSSSITNCYSTGNAQGIGTIGGLAGINESGAEIIHCYSTGMVVGQQSIGGLVGVNWGTIAHCNSAAKVFAGENVGGLVGVNYGLVARSFSAGIVDASRFAGGLAGWNNYAIIINCYSMAPVDGDDYLGGLVGYNERATIDKCYSTGKVTKCDHVGGLVAYNLKGTITASFWDITTSGRSASAGGKGKTTAQMKTLLTFTSVGWDFVGETANGTNDYWRMCVNGINYPLLSWQFEADFLCPDGVDIPDLQFFTDRWLNADCTQQNCFCKNADINYDGQVDFLDFALFASHWLE